MAARETWRRSLAENHNHIRWAQESGRGRQGRPSNLKKGPRRHCGELSALLKLRQQQQHARSAALVYFAAASARISLQTLRVRRATGGSLKLHQHAQASARRDINDNDAGGGNSLRVPQR